MPREAQEPISRTSLVDEIASRLRRDILEGRHVPGQALPPERELATRYGVTRTSLKHALVRLEEAGLIRTQHGVGSIVQDVQQSGGADLLKHLLPAEAGTAAKLLRDVLEVRTIVAGGFARLAARRRDEKDLASFHELLDELAAHRDDAREVQRIENLFFRALARASHNRAFVLLTNSVSAAYRVQARSFLSAYRDGRWVEAALRDVLTTVRDGDGQAARVATERYFEENTRRVLGGRRTKKGRAR